MALSAVKISIGATLPRAETANSGVSAMSGMATRSWNSSTANAMRPWRSASSPFSSSTCRAKAVDDSDSARPANTAAGQARPTPTAMAASSSAVMATWAPPRPKMAARMAHRRLGRSSRPIRNNSSTTPNSAKCRTELTS